MAKTKPSRSGKRRREGRIKGNGIAPLDSSRPEKKSARSCLADAENLMTIGDEQGAFLEAQQALDTLRATWGETSSELLPALQLLGEISVEMGQGETAHDYFLSAAKLDQDGNIPESAGGGAEKFLWLAQLSESGGTDSIEWYQKGVDVLRRQSPGSTRLEGELDEAPVQDTRKQRLANALCSMAEVYMTDLSWEADAEEKCEQFMTEALMVAPDIPEVLQTLASVRISQSRIDDARAALSRSIELCNEMEAIDPRIPNFPSRISLARLLMEVQMEEDATEVLERLIEEDDESIEAWYLGGWCFLLMGEKNKPIYITSAPGDAGERETIVKEKESRSLFVLSREWLLKCIALYNAQVYEDERLKDHAIELIDQLNKELGTADSDEAADEDGIGDDEEDNGWEDGSDNDEEMDDA